MPPAAFPGQAMPQQPIPGLNQATGVFGAPRPTQSGSGMPVAGRLFLTRVVPEVTKADLQLYFQQFGELSDAYIPMNKGIAFVSFVDPNNAQVVLQSEQHFVKPGIAVVVTQAVDRPPLAGGKSKGKGTNDFSMGGKGYNPGWGKGGYVDPSWGKGGYVDPSWGKGGYVDPNYGKGGYVDPSWGKGGYVDPNWGKGYTLY